MHTRWLRAYWEVAVTKWFVPRKYCVYLTPSEIFTLQYIMSRYEYDNPETKHPYGPKYKSRALLYRAVEKAEKVFKEQSLPSANIMRLVYALGNALERTVHYIPKNNIENLKVRAVLIDWREIAGRKDMEES